MSRKLNENQDNGKKPLYGFYRARVESNIDPMRLARVRVRIPQLHGISGEGSLSIHELPWAYPCTMTGTGGGHGSCIVPETGDYVLVGFENGDRNSPFYLGGSFGIPTNPKQFGNIGSDSASKSMYVGRGWKSSAGVSEVPEEVYNNGSPNGKVLYKSPKGLILGFDNSDGQESVYLADNKGKIIKILSNGSDDQILIQGSNGNSIEINDKDSAITLHSANHAVDIKVDDSGIILMGNSVSMKLDNGIVSISAPTIRLDGRVVINY